MAALWVLGIDVGAKKTGVAVGQSVTGLARPLALVKKPAGKLQGSDFGNFIREWSVKCIVVGLPVLADGTAHPLEKHIRRLSDDLTAQFTLPVYFADETLTSHEARANFGSREEYDSAAAAVMVEDFLAAGGYRI